MCMLPKGSVTCGLSIDQFSQIQQMSFRSSIIPHNPNNTLTIVLYHDGKLQGFILLMRRDELKPFSSAHICAMEVLQPHISLQFNKIMNAEEKTVVQEDKGDKLQRIGKAYGFTKRELEVLTGLCEHKSDDEICYTMYITKSTLKKHISHIYAKMSVRNRIEMIRVINDDKWDK